MYVTHVRVSCEVNYYERAGKVAGIMAVGRSYFVRTSLDHRSKHVSMVPAACIFSTESVCANDLVNFGKHTAGQANQLKYGTFAMPLLIFYLTCDLFCAVPTLNKTSQ